MAIEYKITGNTYHSRHLIKAIAGATWKAADKAWYIKVGGNGSDDTLRELRANGCYVTRVEPKVRRHRDPADIERYAPRPNSYAATARRMARSDRSGFDWDRWKDDRKQRDLDRRDEERKHQARMILELDGPFGRDGEPAM